MSAPTTTNAAPAPLDAAALAAAPLVTVPAVPQAQPAAAGTAAAAAAATTNAVPQVAPRPNAWTAGPPAGFPDPHACDPSGPSGAPEGQGRPNNNTHAAGYYGRGMFSGGRGGRGAPFAGAGGPAQGGHGRAPWGGGLAAASYGGGSMNLPAAPPGGHGRGRSGPTPPGAFGPGGGGYGGGSGGGGGGGYGYAYHGSSGGYGYGGAYSGGGGGGYAYGYGYSGPRGGGYGYGGYGGGGGGYQQRAPPRDVKCYGCGEIGHISRNCPSGGSSGSGSRYASGESPRRNGPRGAAPPPWRRRDGGWLEPQPGTEAAAAWSSARAAANAPVDPKPCSGRVVVIMRGLPGSGKSTRAEQIIAEAEAAAAAAAAAAAPPDEATNGAANGKPKAAAVHSTDSFFVDAGSGEYTFDPTRLKEHHAANLAAFEASLAAGVDCVVVDNTNVQVWQYEPYVTAAWRAGYAVREEVVGARDAAAVSQYAARCLHGVSADKIEYMASQWESG